MTKQFSVNNQSLVQVRNLIYQSDGLILCWRMRMLHGRGKWGLEVMSSLEAVWPAPGWPSWSPTETEPRTWPRSSSTCTRCWWGRTSSTPSSSSTRRTLRRSCVVCCSMLDICQPSMFCPSHLIVIFFMMLTIFQKMRDCFIDAPLMVSFIWVCELNLHIFQFAEVSRDLDLEIEFSLADLDLSSTIFVSQDFNPWYYLFQPQLWTDSSTSCSCTSTLAGSLPSPATSSTASTASPTSTSGGAARTRTSTSGLLTEDWHWSGWPWR